MKISGVLLLISVLISSCNCMKGTDSQNKNSSKAQNATIISQGDYGGSETRSYITVNSQEELTRVYSQIGVDTPTVDFEQNTIIVLHSGQKNTGGHSIMISSIEETDDVTYITVKEEGPGPGEMATMALTYPFSVSKISKTNNVVFR